MRRRQAAATRNAALYELHAIARRYFGYPSLSRSLWFLPLVYGWEPDESGNLVLPSVVAFPLVQADSRHRYPSGELISYFKLELERQTTARWYVDHQGVAKGWIPAIRLSQRVVVPDPDNPRHTTIYDLPWDFRVTPALPGNEPDRPNFIASLVRGLFRDEWARPEVDEDASA